MRKVKLGQTGLMVSELCLGSMTWGTQNTEVEGHGQIDVALDHGVNFIDTAEMYPVNPISTETQGDSERVMGTWFEKSGRREDVVLATKHSGEGLAHVRDGARISSKTIFDAVDGSLARLKTDYIDLYQFHWPNRGSMMFRKNWTYDPGTPDKAGIRAEMEDALGALQSLADQGKIRHFGLSNESAWGTSQWLRISEEMKLPRVASIQNEYSLLCRMYDTDLSELSVHEDVTLLAFSPLATGLLTGKYQNGAIPENSRRTFVDNLGGRVTDRVFPAIDAYEDIAKRHGLDLAQIALAWCRTRPFTVSAIFGATTDAQLRHALASTDVVLSDEVITEINSCHVRHPMPY